MPTVYPIIEKHTVHMLRNIAQLHHYSREIQNRNVSHCFRKHNIGLFTLSLRLSSIYYFGHFVLFTSFLSRFLIVFFVCQYPVYFDKYVLFMTNEFSIFQNTNNNEMHTRIICNIPHPFHWFHIKLYNICILYSCIWYCLNNTTFQCVNF